jgi:hypothetical protein
MHKSSFKLYFATILFTLTLASFTFAGDAQCPAPTPPPLAGGDDVRVTVVITHDVFSESFKYFKDFVGLLIGF